MAAAKVAQVTGRPSGTTGDGFTTSAIDTTGANFLYASTSSYTAVGGYVATSMSDSYGNTWTALTPVTQDVYALRMWYVENATTGSGHTFTVTTTNSFSPVTVYAFSGMATTSVLDQQTGTASGAATTHQPGSLTPNQADSLIISSLGTNAANFTSINSGFDTLDTTATTGNSHNAIDGETVTGGASYLIQGVAAAVNPTWTISASFLANVKLAVFKSAVAASNPHRLLMMGAGL